MFKLLKDYKAAQKMFQCLLQKYARRYFFKICATLFDAPCIMLAVTHTHDSHVENVILHVTTVHVTTVHVWRE